MLKKTLIAAGLVAASASAFAAAAPMMNAQQSMPWYVGVGLNYSPVFNDKFDNGAVSLEKRGFGGNVFVGYHVNKYFGTEMGLNVTAKNQYDADGSSFLQYKNRWNLYFNGNAYLPVTDWFSPFVFGGVAYMSNKIQDTANNLTVSEYSGLGFDYGAGLQFNIQQFGVRVKYTHLMPANNFAPNITASGITVSGMPQVQDLVSLDVLYHFGM